MERKRRSSTAAAIFLLAVLISSPTALSGDSVTVSAAVSLRDVLTEIWGPEVVLNAAGSGTLVRQIFQGAPVDLFISASPDELDELEQAGLLLTGSRRNVASNRLVTILAMETAPPGRFADLADPRIARIAIGNPRTVPAGRYAREALQAAGLWGPLEDRLIYAESVRQVVEYVARGDVDAGLVYHTDALRFSQRVTTGPNPPVGSYRPILYQAAVLKEAAAGEAAGELRDHLLTPFGRQRFRHHGFTVPAEAP